MSEAVVRCKKCGSAFTVPESTKARYPGWRPELCGDCFRGKSAAGGKSSARGVPGSRELDLTVSQALETYSAGPNTGLFTDGACTGNPGPGGWGVVHVQEGQIIDQRHGSAAATTNNRMELVALIEAFKLVSATDMLDLYSDSKLVVDTITKWAEGWEARGWKRKKGEVKNLDLVKEAYALAAQRPNVRVEWIRAHDGSLWNEYADSLATAFRRETL